MAGGPDLIAGELLVGGRARGFTMRLPRSTGGGMPLVLVLHGNHPDADGQFMRDWTTFDKQADAQRFRRRLSRWLRGLLGRWPRGHDGRRGGSG